MTEPFGEAPLPGDLAKAVETNDAFRQVLRTPSSTSVAPVQQVAMTLSAGQAIGWERHDEVTQIFVVYEGSGFLLRGRPRCAFTKSRERAERVPVAKGSTWVIEPRTWHDVEAAPDSTLRLLTMYTPAKHERGENMSKG